MNTLQWIGLLFAAALGTTVALFKKYYMPSLDSLHTPTTPPVAPPVPPTAPQPPETANATTKPTLAQFFKYQWQFEGANPANCNPGNYRFYHGGYLPIYGNVKCSVGGFAMFPTLAQGKMYATNSTKSVIKNHPELTILTYIGGDKGWSGYAPASDNNPVLNYANFIAKGLGVDNLYKMSALV